VLAEEIRVPRCVQCSPKEWHDQPRGLDLWLRVYAARHEEKRRLTHVCILIKYTLTYTYKLTTH